MRGLIAPGAFRALAALLLGLEMASPGGLAAATRQDTRLMAGAASVEVTLPRGTPLGGYGGFPRRAWLPDLFGKNPHAFWFRPSTGVHDSFRVRSLVLESGSASRSTAGGWGPRVRGEQSGDPSRSTAGGWGPRVRGEQSGPASRSTSRGWGPAVRGEQSERIRVLWLAVDLVGIDPTLLSELRERLGRQGLTYSVVIASASHTHSGPGAYGDSALFGFLAIDRLSRVVRGRILDGLERAAREAETRKVPAGVASARTEVGDIAESRVQKPLDPELGVVKVTGADGRPVALLWNYAIHGTALGRDNFLLSGDLMAEASSRLEREIGVPALFVNGAVGDVSPRPRGWAGVKAAGEALAAGALRAWTHARTEPGRLQVARERVALPSPAVALRNCSGGWAPAWMTLGLGEALPSSAEITALTIGRTGWVTIPGELETSLGLEVKASGRDRFSHVFIAGVSNDYLGYFLSPADYRRPSYIACGSLYGERGGDIMRDAAVAALRRLTGGY